MATENSYSIIDKRLSISKAVLITQLLSKGPVNIGLICLLIKDLNQAYVDFLAGTYRCFIVLNGQKVNIGLICLLIEDLYQAFVDFLAILDYKTPICAGLKDLYQASVDFLAILDYKTPIPAWSLWVL